MQTAAIVLSGPMELALAEVPLVDPAPDDIVVDVRYSGISTGTEKLLWSGKMPAFPGMGYPLIPGYEAAGEVVEAGAGTALRPGDMVFVPGAACYGEIRGLFGGAARRIVTRPDRVVKLSRGSDASGALLALAATARHAIVAPRAQAPDLIVGHGVLGRLLARVAIARGAPPPTVWETDPARRDGATGYQVLDPDADPRRDYGCIYDATGDASLLNGLIGRLRKGGEIVLAGFYPEPLSFAFPPAFMKEARLRIAAEWTREDLVATAAQVELGALSLDGLITHTMPAAKGPEAYQTAFSDPACLKMILDWSATA